MRKSTGRAMFEAMSMLTAQQMALSNPNSPVAPKPKELSPEEVRANKKRATTAAYEKEYRDREEKRERESKEAQAAGRRNEIFGYMKSDAAERKQFARCNPDILEAAIIEWRKLGNPSEGLVKMYGVLTGRKQ